jgi:ADP-ribosyl-[dinitrogen reductase] hydrolase
MTLCLAESFLESSGFDARDQVLRYVRWQQEGYLSATGQCVGITASTARALAISKWRRQMFAGSHDPGQLDPEPLSRTAAAVLFYFDSVEQAVQQAADAARTTCQSPVVLEACRQLARALHAAVSGKTKAAIVAELAQIADSPPQTKAAPRAAVGAQAGNATQTATTAPKALASAVAAFSSTDNFRDAVLRAANGGGDSDVIAAVCGQLAGAYYGVSAIPATWRNGLIQKELIESYADRLLTHTLLTMG